MELYDLVEADRKLRHARRSLRDLDDCELMVNLYDDEGSCSAEFDITDEAMVASIKAHLRAKLTADLEEATKLLTAAGIDLPEEEPDEEDEGEDEQEAA